MLEVLRYIADGLGRDHGCRTMSDHGGRVCTLAALMRRGLLDRDFEITDAGREAVQRGTR